MLSVVPQGSLDHERSVALLRITGVDPCSRLGELSVRAWGTAWLWAQSHLPMPIAPLAQLEAFRMGLQHAFELSMPMGTC